LHPAGGLPIVGQRRSFRQGLPVLQSSCDDGSAALDGCPSAPRKRGIKPQQGLPQVTLVCYAEVDFGISMVDAMDDLWRACVATQDSLFLFYAGAVAFEFLAM